MQNPTNPIRFREAVCYPYENPEAFYTIRRDCVEAFQPTCQYEMYLVEQIADHKFRLNRCHQLECAHMNNLVARAQKVSDAQGLHQLATLLDNSVKASPFFEIMMRYRGQAERGMRRAQATLLEYRASKRQPTPPAPQPEVKAETQAPDAKPESAPAPTPTGPQACWNWPASTEIKNYETNPNSTLPEQVPREQAFSA